MTLDQIFEKVSVGDKIVITQTNGVWLCPVVSVAKSPEKEGRWIVEMGREKVFKVVMDADTLLRLFIKQEPSEIKLLTAPASQA